METNETNQAAAATQATPVAPPAPNSDVQMTLESFHFKKEKIKDESGTVLGEGKKLPKADLYVPLPTPDYLIGLLAGGDETAKERDLLLSAVRAIVVDQARSQINDFREANKNVEAVTSEALNYDKLLWSAIANMPRAERASSVPSDEDMASFFESYKAIMPEALNKDAGKIAKHVEIFKDVFKRIRAQKPMLEVFKDALAVYVATASEDALEDNKDVVSYFDGRLDRMLNSESKVTMDDI